MVKLMKATSLALLVLASGVATVSAQDANLYLPLAEGKTWVLRSPSERTPIKFQVISREGDRYILRFSSPWATNDWRLTVENGKAYLNGYGANGKLMNLPDDTVFFDFTSDQGTSWKNTVGTMSVKARRQTVTGPARKYDDAVSIVQSSGGSKFTYVFSPGVGFVQFGEGRDAFVLDESASQLSESPTGRPAAPADESRPVPHVPSGLPTRGGIVNPPSAAAGRRATVATGKVLLGTTVSTFANEAENPQNLMKRFDQTIDAGITYISGAGKWTELEPSKGKFRLDPLDFQSHLAQQHNAKISYTLRVIDTIHKVVPSDLERKGWRDPEIRSRVMGLIDAMAPLLRDRVQWFMFGNEVDGYFARHPEEIADFVHLYSEVATRLKELVPGIHVSSTLMFGGIDSLDTSLKALNDQIDFLSLTYYPLESDFTVQDPGAPARDFPRMKRTARGREIVLQEIGYPTGSANKSNQDKQALFFQNVIDQMRADTQTFPAGSFFLLADLRDKFATDLAAYYGIKGHEPFRSFLQTLGMFDTSGRPKRSWEVFRSNLKR